MTLAEMVVDLKNMVGPAGKGSEVSDSGLSTWLQEAYADAIDMITEINPDYFVKISTTSAIIDQREYVLPSDFQKMIAVNVNYGTDASGWVTVSPLQNVNLVEVYSNVDTNYSISNPRYYILGNKVGILPAPTESGTNNIKLIYSNLLAEMGDTSEPSLPRKFHYKLKYQAYANYLDQNDEHVAAERMRNRFSAEITRLAESLETRNVDIPKSVMITSGADMYHSDSYLV